MRTEQKYDALTENAAVLIAVEEEEVESIEKLYRETKKEIDDYTVEQFRSDLEENDYVEFIGNTEGNGYFELTEKGEEIQEYVVDLGFGGGG